VALDGGGGSRDCVQGESGLAVFSLLLSSLCFLGVIGSVHGPDVVPICHLARTGGNTCTCVLKQCILLCELTTWHMHSDCVASSVNCQETF